MTFVTGCDPDYETSLEILKEISKKGSQIVEIGFYNAEAAADGPVISRACERASKAGGELFKVIGFSKGCDISLPAFVLRDLRASL